MRRIRGIMASSVLFAVFLTSCGGGGGSTAAGNTPAVPPSAMTVAEKVSVVDAQSGGGSGAPASALGKIRAVSLPAGSDYNTDKVNIYVEERSVQALNTVNEILCAVAQTRYDAMLNLGPYKAQVDTSQCQGRDDVSAGGQQSANQSSGTNMPKYEVWTVESSRADNASPQILKVWIHEAEREQEPAKTIYARAVITEGVSVSNPYGIFTINFKAFPVVDGAEQPAAMFRGVLKAETDAVSGKVVLKFFDIGGFGGGTFTEKVAVDRSSASTGGGKIFTESISPEGSRSMAFSLAFNDNNFLRVGNQSICLDRRDFDSSAWRYGVYDSDGVRVSRESGFPVRYGTVNGYIGYWGPWFPDNVTLQSGDTVYKQTFGSGGGSETTYQILVAGGKLKKHTRKELLLGEIVNIPLDYSEFGADNQYRIVWNGSAFKKVATLNKANYTWADLTPQVDMDLNALKFSELNFWSQALGGSVQVKLQVAGHDNNGTMDPSDDTFSCVASGSTPVVTYQEVTVNPGDTIPASLACFENCPDAAGLGTMNPFKFVSPMQQVAPTDAVPATYTFNTDNMVLLDGGSEVVSSAINNAMPWGITSGPMFEPTSANLSQLACGFDNTGNTTCAWQARSNLTSYYTWETGPNNWNKFVGLYTTGLLGGRTFVIFEAPIQLQYTHLAAGKYQNAKFYLEYSGFGNLNGIPGMCVNMDTGLAADCSQGGPDSPIRWVPEITIPDGSALTSGGATYYVKALDKEQRMKKVAAAACSVLDVAPYEALTLPSLTEFVDPTTGSGAIGSEPSVTGAPAVIGGVLQ